MSIPQSQTKVLNSADQPPPGWVRLKCKSPTLNIMGPLGPEPPTIGGGFGGYEVVPRPRQVGMTVWNGVEPYQLNFSMFLEGFKLGRSVELDISRLMECAHGTTGEPGTVEVYGIPFLPATDWLFEGLEFDADTTIRNRAMERIRQKISFTLREEINPHYLPMREEALMGKKPGWRMYKVKRGDTPAKIAKAIKAKSWTVLKELNPKIVKKAEQNLKDGIKIKVPVLPEKTGGKRHGKR